MPLLTNILLIAAAFLLIALAIRTGKSIRTTGMPSLFAIIIAFSIWVVGNLIELNTSDIHWMLWGRNIQQIGVFFTPLFTLYFSIEYTANDRLRRYAFFISIIQVISVLLIFTDQFHHIMRESVSLQPDAVLGQAFVVRSTKIGSALVAFNFCIPLISIVNLIAFTRTVSAQLKRPLWLIIISMFVTFLVALVQSTLLCNLGIHIPIPVWNLPCLVVFSFAVLKDGFVGVTPTAFSKVFEVIDQGIIVVDAHGKVIEYNRRADELMNETVVTGGLDIGTNITAYITHETPSFADAFSIEGLPKELKNDQRNQYIALAYHTLTSPQGRLIGYVLVLTDITLLKVRAEIDSLTGSYNREGLVNAFADLCKDAEKEPFLSALIVDLDDFKQVNDTYGHLAGDVILCDFVGVAQSLLSEKRFLGRLGGDEFVVILPAETGEAMTLAETLRELVSSRAVPYLNNTIRYTISVGIAGSKNNENCSLSDLLHRADLALYAAKHQGKNTVHAESAVNAIATHSVFIH
jgi:diguanylate cyclase (GGDEF)-like protein